MKNSDKWSISTDPIKHHRTVIANVREQIFDQLKPEQHVTDKQQLAINILISQTYRKYQELQNYTVYRPRT